MRSKTSGRKKVVHRERGMHALSAMSNHVLILSEWKLFVGDVKKSYGSSCRDLDRWRPGSSVS